MIDTDFDVPDEKALAAGQLYENAPMAAPRSPVPPMAPTPKKAKDSPWWWRPFFHRRSYTRFRTDVAPMAATSTANKSSTQDRRIDDRQQSDLSAERTLPGNPAEGFVWVDRPARRPEGEHPRISRSIWLERRGHDHLQYRSGARNGGVAICPTLALQPAQIFAKFNTLFYASIIE